MRTSPRVNRRRGTVRPRWRLRAIPVRARTVATAVSDSRPAPHAGGVATDRATAIALEARVVEARGYAPLTIGGRRGLAFHRALTVVHDFQFSHVEPEVHHVAVADDVILAFDAEFAGVARLGLAAELHEVLPPDDLGLNEALLEVGVNHPRRLGRLGASRRGPSAHLGLARGEERN